MESLKELLTPKTFNKLSFVAVVFWILLGVTLCGIFADIENSESRFDFRCDAKLDEKDFIRGKCFGEYGEEYNKLSIPVYGFVIINFSVIAIVSVIYSQCIKSTVHELETYNQDVEEQRQQRNPAQRRLFISYCCQLATRFVLAILFIVLQTQVFYPRNFPSNFNCNLMTERTNTSAYLSANVTQQTQTYKCHNQRATKKTFWTDAVAVANGIFAFLALIETLWILSRAKNGKTFMEESQFYADHLKSNRDPPQEQRRQQNAEAVPLTLSLPQETLEQPLQIRIEHLPAALQSEEPGEGPKPTDLDIEEAVPVTLLLPQEALEQPLQIRTEQLAATLQSQQPSQQLQANLKSLKNGIIAGTKQLRDLQQPIRPNPGEGPKPKDLDIDQIYVNLVIHEGRARYDFPQDRQEQLKIFPKPSSNQPSCVRVEDIIRDHHKNVLVVGRPGIGKTMLSTKLLRVSACNEFKDVNFDVTFLLKFRRLNSVTDLDLRELLARSETVRHIDDELWDYIIKNPTKVLLIFDGIDEFSAKADIAKDNSSYNDSVEEKMPLHSLYNKIASGKLLPGATVITTTRPTAVSCVRLLNFDRTVEILGFTSEQVEDYVEKFTEGDHNPDAKETVWQHISKNINLFTLCYIPVNCFIICSCLSLLYTFGSSLPTKLTKIYSIALKIFFFRHNDEYRQSQDAYDQLIFKRFKELPSPVQKVFNRLANIAFLGIKEGRLVFTSREVEGLEDCGLLHRLPDVAGPTPLDPSEAQFCFMHLTVQEFLAAKHVTDTMKKDELREFVTDHINQGAWQVVMQFVAGLLDTDTAGEMPNSDIYTELLPTSTVEKKEDEMMSGDLHYAEEESTTLTCWPTEDEKVLALNLCKCFYELDVKLQSAVAKKIEEINFNAVDFSNCMLAPVDCTAIIGFLKNANGKLFLTLLGNNIGWLGCMEIQKWIVKSDRSEGDCKLRTLNLSRNGTGDKGAAQLRDAFKDENCKLTVLDLGANKIGDKGATNISVALKNVHCKLTVLNLGSDNIGDKGAADLSDALKDANCKLTELNLGDNNIGEKGAAHLSDALKDANCKLTELYLRRNNIGDKGAADLSDALKDANCKLTELNLGDNNIGEKGAAHLSDALKDANCKLTELYLRRNNIGDKGAADLSDALKDANCKLTELNLGDNNIGEKGVAHLSDALKDANCKLTELYLRRNNIGDKGAADLSDALKDANCKLTELKLDDNNIGEKGAADLSDALKDANCKLTELKLGDNNIGEKGAAHLIDALKDANCKLTELYLRRNNIGEKGAAHLSDALKDANCKLTALNLDDNNIGDKGAADLSDALKDANCKLTALNLDDNNIGDKGAADLSDALKDANCKLTALNLDDNNIGDKGAADLSDALKDANCKLTELNLD